VAPVTFSFLSGAVLGFVGGDSCSSVVTQLGGTRTRSSLAVTRCCHNAAAGCRRRPVGRPSVSRTPGKHTTNA